MPKQGFAVPIGSWLRKHLGPLMRDTILSETCRRRGILEVPAIEALVRRHEQGRPLDSQVWTLISFELWSGRSWTVNTRTPFALGRLDPPRSHRRPDASYRRRSSILDIHRRKGARRDSLPRFR